MVKNKVAPPFKSCVVDMIYGQGISKYGELLDLGEQLGLLKKSGNWYELSGSKIGNGREAAKAYLREHEGEASELEQRIRSAIKDGVIA